MGILESHMNNGNTPMSLDDIPCDILLEFDITQFRQIARRTLQSLLQRRKSTKRYELYNYEINRLILHEMHRDEQT